MLRADESGLSVKSRGPDIPALNFALSADTSRYSELAQSAPKLREVRLTGVLGSRHFKNAQMTKPMIKIATTSAASGLSCNAASISFTQTPVRPNDDQIVLRSERRPAYVI